MPVGHLAARSLSLIATGVSTNRSNGQDLARHGTWIRSWIRSWVRIGAGQSSSGLSATTSPVPPPTVPQATKTEKPDKRPGVRTGTPAGSPPPESAKASPSPVNALTGHPPVAAGNQPLLDLHTKGGTRCEEQTRQAIEHLAKTYNLAKYTI